MCLVHIWLIITIVNLLNSSTFFYYLHNKMLMALFSTLPVLYISFSLCARHFRCFDTVWFCMTNIERIDLIAREQKLRTAELLHNRRICFSSNMTWRRLLRRWWMVWYFKSLQILLRSLEDNFPHGSSIENKNRDRSIFNHQLLSHHIIISEVIGKCVQRLE